MIFNSERMMQLVSVRDWARNLRKNLDNSIFLKPQYTQKVSQLEIIYSGKDVRIKLLEDELSGLKTMVAKKDVQLASWNGNEFRALFEEKEQQNWASSDHQASDLQWVMMEGIPSFVRAVMNSVDFGNVNVAL